MRLIPLTVILSLAAFAYGEVCNDWNVLFSTGTNKLIFVSSLNPETPIVQAELGVKYCLPSGVTYTVRAYNPVGEKNTPFTWIAQKNELEFVQELSEEFEFVTVSLLPDKLPTFLVVETCDSKSVKVTSPVNFGNYTRKFIFNYDNITLESDLNEINSDCVTPGVYHIIDASVESLVINNVTYDVESYFLEITFVDGEHVIRFINYTDIKNGPEIVIGTTPFNVYIPEVDEEWVWTLTGKTSDDKVSYFDGFHSYGTEISPLNLVDGEYTFAAYALGNVTEYLAIQYGNEKVIYKDDHQWTVKFTISSATSAPTGSPSNSPKPSAGMNLFASFLIILVMFSFLAKY